MERVTLPELSESLNRARRKETAAIRAMLLDSRFVGITGPADAGKTTLLRLASMRASASTSPVVWVDLAGTYSPRHLARRWLQAVARAAAGDVAFSHISALPPTEWSASTRRADHRIRDLLRDQYPVVLGETARRRGKGSQRDLEAALAVTVELGRRSKRVLLVIDHVEAPHLSRAFDVRELLWQVRAHTQENPHLAVAVATRPGAVGLAADRRAAYYGDGAWLTIDAPSEATWRNATDGWARVEQVWPLTQGHVPTTLVLLARASLNRKLSTTRLFADAALESRPLASRCVEHATALHRLGGVLLQAIARGLGPYQAISDTATRDIAQAAQRLELGGLTHRLERGHWRVVNPLVSAVLRGDVASFDGKTR